MKIQPSLKLPAGWTPATALEVETKAGDVVDYKTTTFNTLVDSPLIAGKYYKAFDLDPGGPAKVTLDVIADRPEDLEAKPEQIAAHQGAGAAGLQGVRLASLRPLRFPFVAFGQDGRQTGWSITSRPRTAPSPNIFWIGTRPRRGRDLLAHEYTHSWDGKFRRGADLWTPSFNVPMRDSLLWVYEGQTQYWGYVLAARSGLMTKQQTLDAIAATRRHLRLSGRAGVAGAGGHHQRSDHRLAPPALLALLAEERGLLFRRPADLARRRHADPGEDRREEIAG